MRGAGQAGPGVGRTPPPPALSLEVARSGVSSTDELAAFSCLDFPTDPERDRVGIVCEAGIPSNTGRSEGAYRLETPRPRTGA